MNYLLSNSFPSPLRSFTLSGFSFDPRELACLKKLQTVDTSVSLHNFYFSSSECFASAINYFPKANEIKFEGCSYTDKEDKDEIKFEGIKINQLTFVQCNFYSTILLKKVLIDSGLAQTFNKIAFKEFKYEHQEDIIKQFAKECQEKAGLNNIEI